MARSETTEHSPSHAAAIDQRGGERRAGMRAQRTQRTTERSLHVGMMMVLARYGWEHGSDARVWDEESRLARRAADLGVDCPWSAEHHCNDDAFVPDTLQLLTSLTALCPGVDRGTAAVIVPWHHPRRVAEQAAVLDMLHKAARSRARPGAARVRRLPQQLDLGWRAMLTGTHVRKCVALGKGEFGHQDRLAEGISLNLSYFVGCKI